jgi:hypothetical protein
MHLISPQYILKKSLIYVIIAITTIYISNVLTAKPVSPEIAHQAATGFVIEKNYQEYKYTNSVQSAPELNLLHIFAYYDITKGFNNALYIYDYNDGKGFIIVSGDDVTIPILGYSFNSEYNSENMPPHVLYWMNSLKDEIARLSSIAQESPEINAEWNHYIYFDKNKIDNPASGTDKIQKVDPMVTTRWDQSPYYNQLCPYDNQYNDRTVTGCVATAMAQVMRFNKYPAKGTGYYSYYHPRFGNLSANFANTTYNWNNMPTSISSNNNDVATLMYHCGVSVDMNYGVGQTGGSGAAGGIVVFESLKKYFGYPESVKFVRKRDYNDADWKNLLRKELDERRPMYYEGTGDGGGHAFVLDGYDGDYFHFNWGWSGQFDGFFLLTSLIPSGTGTGGGGGNFTSNQGAVIGIVSPGGNSGGGGTEDPKKAKIELNSLIYVLTNPILVNGELQVNADIWNNSQNTFKGSACAALFDSQGQFVDFIEIKTGIELQPNYHFTNGITFKKDNLFGVYPGTYYVGIYVLPDGGNWEYISSDQYTGFIAINVQKGYYNTIIGMYKDPEVSDPIYIGKPFSVKFTPANYGNYTFTGEFSVDIFDLDGKYITAVGSKTGISLNAGYYYTEGVTIANNGINIPEGKYLLAAFAKETGGDWVLINPMDFRNPFYINVAPPPLVADKYEDNNSYLSPYKFNINFNGNNASFNTEGSNLHVNTDVDFYSVTLPIGFDYKIKPKVQDYYYTDDGKSYTGDVIFSVKDKANWGEVYDDYPPSDLIIKNGGTIIFKVQPYYETESGTYKLDVAITRTGPTSAEDEVTSGGVKISPNPSDGVFNIKLPVGVQSLQLVDVTGKTLMLVTKEMLVSDSFMLDLSKYVSGVYYLMINHNSSSEMKTLIIER